MPYVDPQTIDNPTAGQPIPAAWADQVRNNLEFLIDPPTCSVYGSGVQSIPNSTDTAMLADSEYFDNDSMHSTSSNTSRITATTAGRYLVISSVSYAASAAARVLTRFRINGTTTYSTDSRAAIGGATPDQVSITRTFVLAAGDYVETIVNQNSGGASDVTLQEFAAIFMTR